MSGSAHWTRSCRADERLIWISSRPGTDAWLPLADDRDEIKGPDEVVSADRAGFLAVVLAIAIHPGGDFGDTFCRAGLVPIAPWCSADAERSYDLIAALDRDPARKG